MKLNWCRFQSGDPGLEAALAFCALDYARSSGQPVLIFDRPAPVVSFSKFDRLSGGFDAAVSCAQAGGSAAVMRISGGQAVAAHPGCLRLTYAAPHDPGQIDVRERFRTVSDPISCALSGLGLTVGVGETPGEWCPGEHSLRLPGGRKIVGIGQRATSDAHHLCALITAADSGRVADMLEPVYESLGYEFSRDSVGDLGGLSPGALEDGLVDAFSRDFEMEEIDLPANLLDQARSTGSSYLI